MKTVAIKDTCSLYVTNAKLWQTASSYVSAASRLFCSIIIFKTKITRAWLVRL